MELTTVKQILTSIILLMSFSVYSQGLSISLSTGTGIVKEEDPNYQGIYPESNYELNGAMTDINVIYSFNKWLSIVGKFSSLKNRFDVESFSQDIEDRGGYDGNDLIPIESITSINNTTILGGFRFKVPHDYLGFYFSPLVGKGYIESPHRNLVIGSTGETANWTFPNSNARLMLEFELGLIIKMYRFISLKASYSTFGGDYEYDWFFHRERADGSRYQITEEASRPINFEGYKVLIGIEINISQLINIKPNNSR